MADEDSNHPRDWGHLKSPFFKLPPEIRNKLYRETFSGSNIDLVIDPPLGVNVVPVTGRRGIFSTVNSSHHFLLTCFQAYFEALAIYWSLTVVRNGDDGHFSRAYFLNRIPAIARPHIQHLRGVDVRPRRKWLRDDSSAWHPSLPKSMDLFPSLKSCSIMGFIGRDFSSYCAQVAPRHPNVHMLEKTVRTLDVAEQYWLDLNYNGFCPFVLSRCTFKHYASGRKLEWHQWDGGVPWLSDEAAFEMLMDPAPNEIESTTSRFELMTKGLFESESEDEDDLRTLF